MTAKEYVRSKMPKAIAESHRCRGAFGKTYWLIRDGKDTYPYSEGTSERNAWVNAKKELQEGNSF